ncbi:RNA 2',3'-cyclic phosphodiesterase [Ralstonia flaminis]|uniref:RNA 2',3'-cyclic phosphodiesterase n=1 Tax=Ralstonia flaminis TaxID=3058597 RepID=A0ABN9JHN4_9RALS|nr:RNA 2',3'-cyclic phosphodiesterase [Ralstonia sp. LMG 18101]CAJ0812044.1 RNA 2',3'-cyclic phosphodiesterase [Ralstonia sp. LMG 18101]
MTQLTLPGFEATPQLPAHRLFLAIKPDAGTAERIARVVEQLRPAVGFKGKALRPERLHITLYHLGDFVQAPPDDLVARTRLAAEGLALPAFDVTFDQVVSFHGRRDHRPFVLLGGESESGANGTTALMAFQLALGEALQHAGLPVPLGHFKPHITLLYDRGGFAPKPVEPMTWTVREFVLIHSWLGKTRYDELGRWTLKG